MDSVPLYENETHAQLRDQARRFAEKHIAPHAFEWDEAGEFPVELYKEASRAGLIGLFYPETYGGGGGDLSHAAAAAEMLILHGKSPGTSASLGSHGIALPPIVLAGTEAQKQRFLPPVLRGEKIAALAVTEPGGGSDVAALRTTRHPRWRSLRRQRDQDLHHLRVPRGSRSPPWSAPDRQDHGGLSLLVIERGTPGFRVSQKLKKTGWWASDTAELSFEDCRVPAANLIGEENEGFLLLMRNFAVERIFLAVSCVAIAELAYRESIAYSPRAQCLRAQSDRLSGRSTQARRHGHLASPRRGRSTHEVVAARAAR